VAGTDKIHPELIKKGGNKLNRMYEVVRQIWEEERITDERKETIIVPIHKRGDRDRCENYMGIALGNAAYKILSNIILRKIKPYIENLWGTMKEFKIPTKLINMCKTCTGDKKCG